MLLVIFISGCATEKGYDKTVNSWLGAHVDQLISIWGVPDKSYTLSDGGKVIEYLEQKQKQMYSLFMGYTYTYTCDTRFTINSKGYVTQYSFSGNNCFAVAPPDDEVNSNTQQTE